MECSNQVRNFKVLGHSLPLHMILNVRKFLYQCKSYLAAFSLRCYAGRKMANEPLMDNQFREINCSPLMFGDVEDSCMKHWSRHGDGTVEIVKHCYPKSIRDNLRMTPDECVRTTADNTVCTCSTDLCNSASNLNHWVTSILVTFCILFVI